MATMILAAATLCGNAAVPAPPSFKDPLDHAAEKIPTVNNRPMMAVAKAGARLVAVGSRGVIMTSDDNGAAWSQASVPVQSDLLAVQFPTATHGWAVGHDGVILHSVDGGRTWVKQLDGRQAGALYKDYYRNSGDAAEPAFKRALAQLELNFKAGPALPYLDVWFSDTQRGYAIGAFGMIAATQDGGKTWEPWLHRIDNPDFLNLNAIRGIGNAIHIVGERGTVFTLDDKGARFTQTATGYAGSFFGIAGNDDVLLAFGLRGNVYRSGDHGSNWEAVKIPADATVMGGAANPDRSGFVLVNSAGQLLQSDAQARQFTAVKPERSMRYTNVAAISDLSLVLTGLAGIRVEPRPAAPH
ncbi:MAG: YCF48-related protein [Pseudomonadota bacterium]